MGSDITRDVWISVDQEKPPLGVRVWGYCTRYPQVCIVRRVEPWSECDDADWRDDSDERCSVSRWMPYVEGATQPAPPTKEK